MWKVSEKDGLLEAHLKKVPKITSKVLHPGNCKQNGPVTLAIFDETTSAAIVQYFPERKEAAKFLRLFHNLVDYFQLERSFFKSHFGACCEKKWQKTEFLRAMANWLEYWHSGRITNCQRFTITTQIAAALIRTLPCHGILIGKLLDEGYEFVLTARFLRTTLRSIQANEWLSFFGRTKRYWK